MSGKLRIPLPFDKVMEAVLKVKPPVKEAPKPRVKRAAKKRT